MSFSTNEFSTKYLCPTKGKRKSNLKYRNALDKNILFNKYTQKEGKKEELTCWGEGEGDGRKKIFLKSFDIDVFIKVSKTCRQNRANINKTC